MGDSSPFGGTKRLIEVDLPIRRISEHARREKSIRHGHISTLHIWWARRPLAACRAVLCASLWPDPADPLCPESFRHAAASVLTNFARRITADKRAREQEQAEQELAKFYPKAPDGAIPIAYLWALTIVCEGPGCGVRYPLLRTTTLTRKGDGLYAAMMPEGGGMRVCVGAGNREAEG